MKTWRFVTIMLVALSLGMAFCHLLEMPARLGYTPELWSRVTSGEGTYRLFGPPLGAAIESAAWIAAVVLAILSRPRAHPVFTLAILGAVCMIGAQVVWWSFVFPVNQEMIGWSPESLPADFEALRGQWETAHAIRAFVQIVGLGAVVGSVLADTDAGSGAASARLGSDRPPPHDHVHGQPRDE